MFSYDKGRFDKFDEYFVDNQCFFEGRLKSSFEDLDNESIIHCINGGGMVRDYEIEREGLCFSGSYYFPDIFEIRECEREELFKVYHLPKYSPCKSEIKERKERWEKRKNEKARKKKTYQSYKYYAKTKFGDVICFAHSMQKLADKMGVSINVIKYRKNHKVKNSWYVETEITTREKGIKDNKYKVVDKNGELIFEASTYEDISLELGISPSTVKSRISKGKNGRVFDDYNIVKVG